MFLLNFMNVIATLFLCGLISASLGLVANKFASTFGSTPRIFAIALVAALSAYLTPIETWLFGYSAERSLGFTAIMPITLLAIGPGLGGAVLTSHLAKRPAR